MSTHLIARRRHEFSFPRLDTLVLVEVQNDEVVIRATRDTFSPQRKQAFLRELAAEGFIPETCAWLGLAQEPEFGPGVRWCVDHSWLELSETLRLRTQRSMVRLFLAAWLLWIGLTVALLAGWFR